MTLFNKDTTGLEVAQTYASLIKGKTVVITGPSDGTIGGQTALDIASGGAKEIFLAGRSLARIQPVINAIQTNHISTRVSFVLLDLADLSSVRKAAQEICSKTDRLDVLINNAGVMAVKDYTRTKDGFEVQFGANHIGHFLLTNLLLSPIIVAQGRIVNVASLGYMSGGVLFDDPAFENGSNYNPWIAYAQSKTANILFTRSLASKLGSKKVKAYALNPGLVLDTKLMANVTQEMFSEGHAIATAALGDKEMPAAAMTPKSLAASDATTLYGAFSPDLEGQSGAFLVDAQVFQEPLLPHATSDSDAVKLWQLSEKLVGEQFPL